MQIDRPESVIVWKRAAKVQDLLRRLGDGTIPVSHEGLNAVPGKPTEHLRALLQHHGLLPQRDPYLSRFEQWIDAKLDGLPDEVRQPVQHFATWHHLRRVRAKAAAGASTRGPVHSAKQEITETVSSSSGSTRPTSEPLRPAHSRTSTSGWPPGLRHEPRSGRSSWSRRRRASTPPSSSSIDRPRRVRRSARTSGSPGSTSSSLAPVSHSLPSCRH